MLHYPPLFGSITKEFSPVSLSFYSQIFLSASLLEYSIPVIHIVNPLGLSSTLHHRARAARARYTANIFLPVLSTGYTELVSVLKEKV